MKKFLPALALVLASSSANAETTGELPRAIFGSEVTDLDWDRSDGVVGCQLQTTTTDNRIRLTWIASESAVLRQSLSNGTVKASMKITPAKLAERDGAVVFAYRETNAVVLIVAGKEMFATTTARADHFFDTQSCGIGIALLFTRPLVTDGQSECNQRIEGTHFPGFCGKVAHLEGRNSANDKEISVAAGIGQEDKIRVVLHVRPVQKPSP